MAIDRSEAYVVQPGAVVRHYQKRAVHRGNTLTSEVIPGCLYQLLDFAYYGRTRQEMCVVKGLEGPDKDRLIIFTLDEFGKEFQPDPVEPPPEKVAGQFTAGPNAG